MTASVVLLSNSVFATDETPKVETKNEQAKVTVKETAKVENKITAAKSDSKVAVKKVSKKAKITEKKVCKKRLGSRLKRKKC